MDRATPVRNPHASTADLLTWSETPASNAPPSATRSHQPSDRIGKVLSGDRVTDEESDSFNRRKPCSGHKLKEITGNKIFEAEGENGAADSGSANFNPNSRTSVRIVQFQQAVHGISQISFSTEEDVVPKKPISIPEVAKQRELSGTLSDADNKVNKQLSDAKCKELSGHDIFGPPPEVPPRSLTARNIELRGAGDMGEPAPRILRTSVKVSNPAGGQSNILFGDAPETKTTKKINNQKFAELTGNDIFEGDVPPGSAEKPVSVAKMKEMTGSDIFSDGKVESRDFLGGVRQPPGGASSIALV